MNRGVLRERALTFLGWTLPPAVCLALYWDGLRAWFKQDDFAWLSLSLAVHDWRSFLEIMFVPMAQGTIRPLSERGFFLLFHALFGMDALPFRIWVFLTMFGSLWLAGAVAVRLTGSPAARVWAPVFWVANSGLAVPLAWTSTYNQVMCAFFLLAAFYWLLRYIESGRRFHNGLQWTFFLLGFGALELNVVYPVLAAAYTWLCARRQFRPVLWLFLPSLAFAGVHRWVAPRDPGPSYTMYFDAGIFSTLGTYLSWATGVVEPAHHTPSWTWLAAGGTLAGVALAGFAAWKIWRREGPALFVVAWFVAVIAPVLPLRNHVSEYYMAIPTIAVGWMGAWGLIEAFRRSWLWRGIAAAIAAAYLASSGYIAVKTLRFNYSWSRAARDLFFGVEQAHRLHPDKIILLDAVGSSQFWACILDRPFRLIGPVEVYLTPGSEKNITAAPELGDVEDFVLPARAALKLLEEDRAVVYSAAGPRLRNETLRTKALARIKWKPGLARRVDVGQPLLADQLGPEWYPQEGHYRWMPQRATVRLGGPDSSEERLYLRAYCPFEQLRDGPLRVTVLADNLPLGSKEVAEGGVQIEMLFSFPAQLIGKEGVEVTIETDRTFALPADGRRLGLAFGIIAIR